MTPTPNVIRDPLALEKWRELEADHEADIRNPLFLRFFEGLCILHAEYRRPLATPEIIVDRDGRRLDVGPIVADIKIGDALREFEKELRR